MDLCLILDAAEAGLDLTVIPGAVTSGVIGLFAGMGGGYLYAWLDHRRREGNRR